MRHMVLTNCVLLVLMGPFGFGLGWWFADAPDRPLLPWLAGALSLLAGAIGVTVSAVLLRRRAGAFGLGVRRYADLVEEMRRGHFPSAPGEREAGLDQLRRGEKALQQMHAARWLFRGEAVLFSALAVFSLVTGDGDVALQMLFVGLLGLSQLLTRRRAAIRQERLTRQSRSLLPGPARG